MARRAHRLRSRLFLTLSLLCVFLVFLCVVPACHAQVPPSIALMAQNELTARLHPMQYAYLSEERSDRTGMHLWRERVVEVGHSSLRRLIAVDGQPLTPAQTQAETDRLHSVVADEAEYWRVSESHKDDEKHLGSLLDLLARAFTVTPDGADGDCTRYRFEPNPAFRPSSYEERVGAAMEGTVSLREPADRLCTLNARLQHKVTFGYGLIGRINSGGNFRLEREPIVGTEWKSDKIVIHLGGKVLMMKSIAKDQETVRTDVHMVPHNLTLTQALQFIQP